jgi:molybdopterin converting factor small subunit
VTIAVTVQYYNILRRGAGIDEEQVHLTPGSTVGDALAHLASIRGAVLRSMLLTAEGHIAAHVVVFRNRKLIPHNQFDTELAQGDELKLFPAISGG